MKRNELNIFKIDDLFFNFKKGKNIRNFIHNDKYYTAWVINTLEQLSPLEKPNERYNALCIYMNENRIDELSKYLSSMTFLNISPVKCNELNDDEFGVYIEAKEKI